MSVPAPRWHLVQGSRAHRAYCAVAWGGFAVLAVLTPFVVVQTRSLDVGASTYTVGVGNLGQAVALTVAVLGVGLLVGFNGQISLGNSFFVGVGAYVTAVLVADHGWPWLATPVVVVPACFAVGLAVGIPALRIRGLYLALVTLGLAATFPALARLEQLERYTGGSNGKRVPADLDPPPWLPLDGVAEALQALPVVGSRWFGEGGLRGGDAASVFTCLVLVAVAAACFWVVGNVVRSRPGRAVVAVRDDETAAAASGIDVARCKTVTFGISAALGGVAGTMYAMQVQFVAPDVFGVNLAIFLVVGLVVGGVGTLSGAVVGGLVIVFVPHWASQVESMPLVPDRYLAGPTAGAVLGVLLVVLTFVLPGGVVWAFRRWRARVVRVVPRPLGAPRPGVTAEP